MLGARETAMAESEIIFTVEESTEGGFEARALGYSIFTEAETLAELRAMVQDAVRCHFDEAERPSVIRLHPPATATCALGCSAPSSRIWPPVSTWIRTNSYRISSDDREMTRIGDERLAVQSPLIRYTGQAGWAYVMRDVASRLWQHGWAPRLTRSASAGA
jgi:hypothetical protein